MCSAHTAHPSSSWKLPPVFVQYLIMIALGIAAGLSGISVFQQTGIMVSDLFVNLFKFISMPVIALSIIVTLSNYSGEAGMKTVWQRTLRYTISTTFIAASLSCLIYLIIQPSLPEADLQAIAKAAPQTGYLAHLSRLVPSNAISPFAEHQVIAVLLISLLFGFAIRFIPDETARLAIQNVFNGFHGMYLVITRWIIAIIPLGLFGFVTATVVQIHEVDIQGIGEYLLVILLANLIQGFVILPLWLKWKGVAPFQAMRGMIPALSLAFFSKSSVGTLPVTMNTIEKNLGVKPQISRFVLPLCTTINMNGCAAFIFATVVFLMQNHGIAVTLPMMGLWIVISTIAALGNAGVPMGCFFLSASLLVSMNVPITLLGIILPFYTLIDMLETALNVWSDACVTKIVNDGVSPTKP